MQPQSPNVSTSWVSFDDDIGGPIFRAPAAPSFKANVGTPSAQTGWAVNFDSAGPSTLAPEPHVGQGTVIYPAATIPPSVEVAAAAEGLASVAPPAAPLSHLDTSTPVLTAASSTSPQVPIFPSFASLYTGAPAAITTANTSAPSATIHPSSSFTPSDSASTAAAGSGNFIQGRLPRPPISMSRGAGALPSAAAINPFNSNDMPPHVLGAASSNPFAASANPIGATTASHSLDPFADLSLRPSLPRPPPMAASRGPSSIDSPSQVLRPVATGITSPGALQVGQGPSGDVPAGSERGGALVTQAGLGPAKDFGLTAPAGAGLRRPPTASVAVHTQSPPASQPVLGVAGGPVPAIPPVASTAAPSVFPSFATLHEHQHQQPKQLSAVPSAQVVVPHLLDDIPAVGSPAIALTGSTTVMARPGVGVGPGAFRVAAGTPQPSATQQELGALSRQGHGAIDLDTFLPAAKSSPPQLQGQAGAPPPPPPPYSAAVNLPDAASSLNGRSQMDLPLGLPPPPPYTEALDMPDAQPSSLQPPLPPSYDEAVTFTAAVEPSLDRVARPLPRDDVSLRGAYAAFDNGDVSSSQGTTQSANLPHPCSSAPSSSLASTSFAFQSSTAKASSAPLPNQICVEVRLPPLKPKEAAWPKRMVAGMGMLFAAPGVDGVAALQWLLLPGAGPGSEKDEGSGPHFALPRDPRVGLMAQRNTEDADSAPAASVLLPPTSELQSTCCMLLDDISGSLWTGHKDGRVVRWRVEPGMVAVYEHHWRAHVRGKITSMTLSSWGDLWTASSGGTIRVWQYQAGLPASRPPTKLFECRRCRPTMGPPVRGNAPRPHSKARLLCLGPSGRVVWSAGRTGMALWGAYDGEFLGTLTPGLQQDSRMAGGSLPGGAVAAGAYAGDTGALYKDGVAQQQQLDINPQTGLEAGLINRPFQPRRAPDLGDDAEAGDPDLDLGQQVIKGLAGAAKLAFKLGKKIRQNFSETTGVGAASEAVGISETNGNGPGSRGKVVALLPGLDQSVYVAYHGGLLEKYTEWGRLLWSRDYGRRVELYSAALVGSLLWLGCGDGKIRTATAASGELCHAWKAHDFPVMGLAHDLGSTGRGSALVYSLSESGSVRGWPAAPPSEAQRLAWRDGLLPSLRPHKLAVLVATWNVNETRPSSQSLSKWLEPASRADIVSISLQEVEMGTSSVAWDAAVTLLSKSMLERGNQNAQWWATELAAALTATGRTWERVALRQMSGLVIVVFCRTELQAHVGEVSTANVACGVMGVGGNKGAVAVSMSVFRRRVMFVCSHFAAHQERVDDRNENYNKIVRMLHFDNTSKVAQQQQMLLRQQQQQMLQQAGEAGGDRAMEPDFDGTATSSTIASTGASASENEDDGHGPGLSDAALLVWAGDFNYRINGTYAEVREWSCSLALRRLFKLDQCRIEMEKGNVFRGLREPLPVGHPVFVPTYKFDKNEPHRFIPPVEPGGRGRLNLPYDTSEKQRVPAWTDRVFFRGSRPGSLDVAAEEVTASIDRASDYNCVLDINDSDHKPVFALLQVQLPGYAQEQKRRHSLASALAVHQAVISSQGLGSSVQQPQPVQVSVSRLDLRSNCTSTLELFNCSTVAVIVQVMTERRHGASSGRHALAQLPCWLEVSPITFYLAPRLMEGDIGGDSSQGRARVSLRVLAGESLRPSEPLQLRFVFRPLWGSETLAAALGPVVSLTFGNSVF
ncbi:hypothetical protein VaNZ11_000355 [Volvox africanus]|uniref:Inositol polyphosphate-related phosphatase domain-containing protein n=1 Tax=Volvox africanus TaxID=51714 RepID=A0ABQ5RLY7_9CHLO|nr:hypothetical protein VaNZ11_000355 [Volvox africanus]